MLEPPDMTKHGKAEQSAARHERLSAALRENLKRRKAQARGKVAAGGKQAAAGEELVAEDLAARDARIGAEPDFRRNPGPESGATGRPGSGRGGS